MVTKKPKKATEWVDMWIDGIRKMGEQKHDEKQVLSTRPNPHETELMKNISKLIDAYENPTGNNCDKIVGCEISFVDDESQIMHNYSYNGESFVKVGELLW